MRTVFFLFLLLLSCAPETQRDLKAEGIFEIQRLAKLLQEIETKDQLHKNLSKIESHYSNLAEIVIQLRDLREELIIDNKSFYESEELFKQLARLYEMPGCKALLEKSQEIAVQRLKKRGIS